MGAGMAGMWRRLWQDRRGVSAIEFAMILPILAALSIGTIEYGRMILLSQKLQNGTFILADLAARDKTLTEEQLGSIFLALDNIIQPFEFDDVGAAIISGIEVTTTGRPIINWQRSGANGSGAASEIGGVGAVAVLPEELLFTAGETLIVSEVFYDFQPIFRVTSPARLHKIAYVKPRLGTLTSIAP